MFASKVYEATKRIPKGKVATYSLIAKTIGKPKAARAVGNALNKNSFKEVPCHRVINSNGKVGGYAYGTSGKIEILSKEGIKIENGRVRKQFILNYL